MLNVTDVFVLFVLKVMNMYGELIMESAHHKVSAVWKANS